MQAISDFIFLALNLSVPLILAAEAAMIAERAGVICLGVEGMMTFGAFTAVVGSHYTSNPWIGVGISNFSWHSGWICIWGIYCKFKRTTSCCGCCN